MMFRRKLAALTAIVVAGAAILASCDQLGQELPRTVPVYGADAVSLTQAQADSIQQDLNVSQEFSARTEQGTLDLIHPDFQSVPTSEFGTAEGSEGEGSYTSQFFDFQGLTEYPAPPNADTALQIVNGTLNGAGAHPAETFGGEHATVASSTSTSRFEMVDAATDQEAFGFELDRSVDFTFQVDADQGPVPFLGPGARVKFSLARNNAEQVIRGTLMKYSLWNLEPLGTVEVISQAEAERQCAELYAGTSETPTRQVEAAQVELSASARLVYFAPPIDTPSTTVYPYYECEGSLVTEGEEALLRKVLIQATDEAPDLNASTADHASSRSMDASIDPASLTQVDVGVEYIADSQGLPGSVGNADGFVSAMQGASVPVEFVWSDFNAWEQDFKDPSLGGNDSSWVDNVDAVFYTGHADGNGFTFPGNQDDGKLRYDEARWGDRDLEWLVIAACGPLQPSAGGLSWGQRWGDAFTGLHLLLAYAETSYVRKDEGRTYAEGLVNGKRVRNAWVDAAMLQPSGVTYAYMGVADSDGQTNFNDYFWGRGLGGGPDITTISYYWKVSGES